MNSTGVILIQRIDLFLRSAAGYGLFLFAAIIAIPSAQGQQAQPSDQVVIKIDPVTLIKKSTTKYQGTFKLSERSAVSQMDAMLTAQYASRGRISNERDASLKTLYYQAATLILNGYPISGGMIVSVARSSPRFEQSQSGIGMASFVDAMLQPTDEDLDLLEMQKSMERARSILKDLRADIRFYADLWVVGQIYHDDIAVDAGKMGIEEMKATPVERRVIKKALAAI